MADVTVGASLQLQGGEQAIQTVKSFKQQLREAQQEAVVIGQKFGLTSEEAAKAAQKVANLKDEINDTRNLIDAFNPDTKFKAFGAALTTVTSGFAALQGAMGLVGAESDDLQKSLLKVQSAMALSQGLAGFQEGIQSVKSLGSVLVNTLGKGGLIGIAIAGVGVLTAYFTGLFDSVDKNKDVIDAYNDSLKSAASATASAIQKVTEVKVAFDNAKQGVISKQKALEIYNETLGDSLGKTNSLTKAEQLLADKADDYIKITGLKAQANALFAKSAQISADALIAQQQINELKGNDLVNFAIKKYQEQVNAAKDSATEINKLGENLLRDAEKIASSSKIRDSVDNKIIADNAAEAKKRLEQARKDMEEEIRLRAAHISGTVTVQRQQTPEEQDIEARIGAFHKLVDERQKDDASLRLLDNSYTKFVKDKSYERMVQEEQEFQNKKALADASSSLLSAAADLVGKQTAAGKILGIAQATINTYIGATEVLRTKSVLPEPVATISKIINVAAVIATGLGAVKNIIKTQVAGAGGGSVPSVSAPLAPQIPTATTTTLDAASLNKIGNATVRAFVVESDVTNNQERVTRLNRAARLG